MLAASDPYAVLAAWLGGLAVGLSISGYAAFRREQSREQEARRAERRIRGRWQA